MYLRRVSRTKQVWSSATFSPATAGTSGVISSGTTLAEPAERRRRRSTSANTLSDCGWLHSPVRKPCTVGGSGEGVVNDGVQGTGTPGGGHGGESRDQTGKDEELLLCAVVPQRLQPQQEEADPLAADLGERSDISSTAPRLRHPDGCTFGFGKPTLNEFPVCRSFFRMEPADKKRTKSKIVSPNVMQRFHTVEVETWPGGGGDWVGWLLLCLSQSLRPKLTLTSGGGNLARRVEKQLHGLPDEN